MVPDDTADLSDWLRTQEELAELTVHDLRNPLAAIQTNLDFLDLSIAPKDLESREAIADIRLAAEALSRLVTNQAAVARLESPRASGSTPGATSLPTAVRSAAERARNAARSAGVTLSLQLPTEDLRVIADDAQLAVLVDNLMGNAIQHVPRDRSATFTVESRGPDVLLVLEDEGTPFGPVGRDFGRKGQLEAKRQPDSRYSRGLALYVVGLIARACGATIGTGTRDGRSLLTVSFLAIPT